MQGATSADDTGDSPRSPSERSEEREPGLPCQKSSNSIERVSAHHRKAAACLAWNVAALVERHGLAKLGFLTVTPPDHCTDRAEWQRRWNSFATNVLRRRYPDWLRVVERMGSRRIHAHCLVALPFDVRTGFDFEAVSKGDYRSASSDLRAEWRFLRDTLPRYGFGRHELMPIRTTGDAMGAYVGKYIGKHLEQRPETDKGWRLVAYGSPARVARTRFSWATQGLAWRLGCAAFSDMIAASKGLQAGSLRQHGMAAVLGKRWAYEWRETILALGTPLAKPLPSPASGTQPESTAAASSARTGASD